MTETHVWGLYIQHAEFDPDMCGIVFAVEGTRTEIDDVVDRLSAAGYDARWGWEPPYDPAEAEQIVGFWERNEDYLYGIRKDYTMSPSETGFAPVEIVGEMEFYDDQT